MIRFNKANIKKTMYYDEIDLIKVVVLCKTKVHPGLAFGMGQL